MAVHDFSCGSELFVGMKVERKSQSRVEKVPPHHPSGNEVSQGYDTDPRNQPRPRKSYTQPRDSSMPRFVESCTRYLILRLRIYIKGSMMNIILQ